MRLTKDATGLVRYSDINAMVRLGQRTELEAYFRQFHRDMAELATRDLGLAKSRLIALITALVTSILEIGAAPETERRIADAAELISGAERPEKLIALAKSFTEHLNVCAKPHSNRFAVELIERCKQAISSRYREPLTDEFMAEQVHLSRSHFRYLFKEITGIPFKRYLSAVRINAARELLEETNLSVKEICAEVGYADTSSFYRAYRNYFGVRPTAHRKASI